ncbi:MAG: ATP-binding protein [Kiritimatiellales bacterium]
MIQENSPFIQVICGPRQVGKTTAARQIMEDAGIPSLYAAADSAVPLGTEWLETQWHRAEYEVKTTGKPVLLVLDELQKISGWSDALKFLWDQRRSDIRLLVLGSSAMLLQRGLTESLAGRFFLHRFPHWSFPECREAFGWDMNRWLFFGGYPGAARFANNEAEWMQYVSDSLIETVISRDVLQLQNIAKPALLRNLFGLATTFPAQILSYNKMLGQLQDAGNTTTLAHYLTLLESAFLLSGLELYSKGQRRKRGSSPKLILWNNALINAIGMRSMEQCITDSAWRGRLVENAVGAHLLQTLHSANASIMYWRKGNLEVDFVVELAGRTIAVEVKSGHSGATNGLATFKKYYPDSRVLLVGENGIPLEEFFSDISGDFFRL